MSEILKAIGIIGVLVGAALAIYGWSNSFYASYMTLGISSVVSGIIIAAFGEVVSSLNRIDYNIKIIATLTKKEHGIAPDNQHKKQPKPQFSPNPTPEEIKRRFSLER